MIYKCSNIIFRLINKLDLKCRSFFAKKQIKKSDIIFMGSSAQTNLGDHAISIASLAFFEKYLPQKRVLEISKEMYYKHRCFWQKNIGKDKIIAITGGGFLGDLWMTEEEMVRAILNDFADNRVVILPQTIFFSSNSDEYNKTFSSYKKVEDLEINARDKSSFELLNKELENEIKVHYIPDMVLSLQYRKEYKRNQDVLLILRTDKESCLLEKDERKLCQQLYNRGLNIKKTSTICNHIVPIVFRKLFVVKKLNEFSKAKLVVTNRLHAMIFAAITGTPCVAIDNLSKKVSGVYEWIKDLNYIYYVEELSKIEEAITTVITYNNMQYNDEFFNKFYEVLADQFKKS